GTSLRQPGDPVLFTDHRDVAVLVRCEVRMSFGGEGRVRRGPVPSRRPPDTGHAEEPRLGGQLGAVLHYAIGLETEVVGNDQARIADLAAFPPLQADRLAMRFERLEPPGHLDLRGLFVPPYYDAAPPARPVGLCTSHEAEQVADDRRVAGLLLAWEQAEGAFPVPRCHDGRQLGIVDDVRRDVILIRRLGRPHTGGAVPSLSAKRRRFEGVVYKEPGAGDDLACHGKPSLQFRFGRALDREVEFAVIAAGHGVVLADSLMSTL